MASRMYFTQFHYEKHIFNYSKNIQCLLPSFPSLTLFPSQNTKNLENTSFHMSFYLQSYLHYSTNPNWYNHPLILNLHNYKSITIPTPPTHPQPHQEWLNYIFSLAKTTEINARKITITYTKKCV